MRSVRECKVVHSQGRGAGCHTRSNREGKGRARSWTEFWRSHEAKKEGRSYKVMNGVPEVTRSNTRYGVLDITTGQTGRVKVVSGHGQSDAGHTRSNMEDQGHTR